MNPRVLFAGESWMTHSIHVKGFDSFTTSDYEEGTQWLKGALEKGGIEVIHIPNHKAPRDFPSTATEIEKYDAVILSDIGSNTLLLHPDTLKLSQPTANRLRLLKEYVAKGGGLIMFGGWMSFQGIEGKANYKGTEIEEILPIQMVEGDDRVEVPEGFSPRIIDSKHPLLEGVPTEWPLLLSYNRLKAKKSATVLAMKDDDVIWAIGDYGKGRTMAFAVDCAPHGAPLQYLEWEYFPTIWQRAVRWLVGS